MVEVTGSCAVYYEGPGDERAIAYMARRTVIAINRL
jgi:hypothetical protein